MSHFDYKGFHKVLKSLTSDAFSSSNFTKSVFGVGARRGAYNGVEGNSSRLGRGDPIPFPSTPSASRFPLGPGVEECVGPIRWLSRPCWNTYSTSMGLGHILVYSRSKIGLNYGSMAVMNINICFRDPEKHIRGQNTVV